MINERFLFILVFMMATLKTFKSENSQSLGENFREKRQINSLPLVYPYGGTYKLLIGFAAPVHVENYISLLFAANFQYQYLQIQNISSLSQYYFIKEVSREERDADLLSRRDERLVFYKSLADMLEMKGFGGQDCVLRAICENAQYPLEDEGLVGEILHILLTPDYGYSAFEKQDSDWSDVMSMYKDAATAGKQMFNCGYIYNGCPEEQSLLDLISVLRDELE
nr:uncharacterized protein LOC116768158 [Danaus plexippus plexippus]